MDHLHENRPIRPRRQPQKGLTRFRYETPEGEVRDAAESVRRWWWEYLRLSKDYWLVCKTSSNRNSPRTIDEGLARIFQKFGNIYDITFEDWWRQTGAIVFQEQSGPPKVIEISEDLSNLRDTRFVTVLLQVPLDLSRVTIQRQISSILKQYGEKRPRSKLEISTSEFPIHPARYRMHILQAMHEAHCLHRELIDKPTALRKLAGSKDERKEWKQRYEQRADLFRIGKLLHISPSNEDLTGSEDQIRAKQNRMRASVSRYLRRAQQLIGNVESGRFPVFATARTTERFSRHQQERHRELEAEWWSLDLNSTLSGNRVDDARRFYYAEYGREHAI